MQWLSIVRFLFVCEDWLALDQSDGCLERCIPVTTKDTPFNSGLLLRHNANQKLTDDHLWFSVISKQYWSQFTRVQRLSVCMATLFLTMVADAMWYNTGTKTSTGVFSFGPITLSMTEVTNSIISSLMVLPPVFLITYIFTHVTPKYDTPAEANTKQPAVGNILKARYEEMKRSSKKFRCPAFCVYISWLLVVLSVLVSSSLSSYIPGPGNLVCLTTGFSHSASRSLSPCSSFNQPRYAIQHGGRWWWWWLCWWLWDGLWRKESWQWDAIGWCLQVLHVTWIGNKIFQFTNSVHCWNIFIQINILTAKIWNTFVSILLVRLYLLIFKMINYTLLGFYHIFWIFSGYHTEYSIVSLIGPVWFTRVQLLKTLMSTIPSQSVGLISDQGRYEGSCYLWCSYSLFRCWFWQWSWVSLQRQTQIYQNMKPDLVKTCSLEHMLVVGVAILSTPTLVLTVQLETIINWTIGNIFQ